MQRVFLIFVCLVANTFSHSGYEDVQQSARTTPSFLPILELIDVSLDKWGSKVAATSKTRNFTGDQAVTPNTINTTGWENQQASVNLLRFAHSGVENNHRFIVVFAACVVALLCLAGVMYMFESAEEKDFEEMSSQGSPRGAEHREPDSFLLPGAEQQSSHVRRPSGKNGEGSESPTKAPPGEPDGSWVRAYREAGGPRKAALELLFKCQIISNQEFLFSRVSQEHIDECVWVGNFMLQQKSLEEWESLWQQAQQTFEDSVTQCFTARTDARSFGPVPPSGIPKLDCQSALQLDNDFAGYPEGPCSTRDGFQSPSLDNDNPLSPATEDRSIRGRSEDLRRELPDRGLSPIISRCRAIISASPQEGVPSQNPKVVRSTSVATTVAAFSGSRQNSVSKLSPVGPARETVDVSRRSSRESLDISRMSESQDYSPQPQMWPAPGSSSLDSVDISQIPQSQDHPTQPQMWTAPGDSREPVDTSRIPQSQDYSPQPQMWAVPGDSREPGVISQRSSRDSQQPIWLAPGSSREPVDMSLIPGSRVQLQQPQILQAPVDVSRIPERGSQTFLDARPLTQGRPATPPVALLPLSPDRVQQQTVSSNLISSTQQQSSLDGSIYRR